MNLLPTELLTLLGSSLLGGIMRTWGCAIESKRLERIFTLQALNLKSSIIESARIYENRGFQWTRRFIAITATFFIIAFPKIIAVTLPNIPIHFGYNQITPGFLFFNSLEKINWITLNGLAITPLDTHLLAAIVGLYFGGSLISKR